MKSITVNSGLSVKSAIYYLWYYEPVPEIGANFTCDRRIQRNWLKFWYNSINMDIRQLYEFFAKNMKSFQL